LDRLSGIDPGTSPVVLAAEIIANLEAALEQFREVAGALGPDVAPGSDV
jgi:hypothetical protein